MPLAGSQDLAGKSPREEIARHFMKLLEDILSLFILYPQT